MCEVCLIGDSESYQIDINRHVGLDIIEAEFLVATESLGPVIVYRTFRPEPVGVADQECVRSP